MANVPDSAAGGSDTVDPETGSGTGSDRGSAAPADSRASDEGDVTLQESEEDRPTPWSQLVGRLAAPAARRGLLALAMGVLALVWPEVTFLVLGGILAVGVTLIGVSDLVGAVRRDLGKAALLKALLLIVIGVALLLTRADSIDGIGRALGIFLVAGGLLDAAVTFRRRRGLSRAELSWQLTRAGGSIVLGGLTVLSPETVATTALLVVATVWIAAAVIVVVDALDPRAQQPLPSSRNALDIIQAWLRRQDMGPAGREAVTDKLVLAGRAQRRLVARFVTLMLFSTAIATLGIQTDSTAVVIGAMLIAPLMTPILGGAASLLMGWPKRAAQSLALVALGVGLGVGASWLIARLAPTFLAIETNSQVTSRVQPTLLDLLIALAAGGAGAFAVSRTDVADSLPGVAIAVALVPPLAVVGVSLQSGEWEFATGALLLFLTNFVGIVFAAGLVFVAVGFAPWRHLQADRRRVVRHAATVTVGLMLVALPLSLTGEELTRQATDRSAVEKSVDSWLQQAPDFTLARAEIAGRRVTVVVLGVGEAPPAEELAALLADELDRAVELDLRIVPEERVLVPATPES